jgi:hypothetical protein
MTARFTILGVGLSQKQAAMLCELVKKPMAMDGITGHDRNALTALADQDVIEVDDTKATITDKGRKVVIELNRKVNGETATPNPETKPAIRKTTRPKRETKPTKRESPPPTGVVDFDALRAQIVAHYEADLAACDRMREIAARVSTS